MQIIVDVEGADAQRILEIAVEGGETINSLVDRIATELSCEKADILADIRRGGLIVELDSVVGGCVPHDHRIHHRRVCIELHFESEHKVHHFPSTAHWERVRLWGCKEFDVARDASANLELRARSETGPPLNESREIGHVKGCEPVWMVKPGPEPYGGS
ncbi:MAG TPA: hypothetical protein VI756_09890 [Blastocatellia bacterium]